MKGVDTSFFKSDRCIIKKTNYFPYPKISSSPTLTSSSFPNFHAKCFLITRKANTNAFQYLEKFYILFICFIIQSIMVPRTIFFSYIILLHNLSFESKFYENKLPKIFQIGAYSSGHDLHPLWALL